MYGAFEGHGTPAGSGDVRPMGVASRPDDAKEVCTPPKSRRGRPKGRPRTKGTELGEPGQDRPTPNSPYEQIVVGARVHVKDAAKFGPIDCKATVLDVRLSFVPQPNTLRGIRVRLDDPQREIWIAPSGLPNCQTSERED